MSNSIIIIQVIINLIHFLVIYFRHLSYWVYNIIILFYNIYHLFIN